MAINLKKVIFMLPLVIILFYSLVILYKSREIIVFDEIFVVDDRNRLYGPALSNYTIEYKYRRTLYERPELLIIGTSRVMQISNFSYNGSFYNAGGIIQRLGDLTILINELALNGYIPSKIIVGLDQNFFNIEWDQINENDLLTYKSKLLSTPGFIIPNRVEYMRIVLTDFKDLQGIINYDGDNIGINAIINNAGFRSDGTYTYGLKHDENSIDNEARFEDTFSRIERGDSGFEYSDEANKDALDYFDRFLSLSKSLNIEVISFMPPYAPSIYQNMICSGNYGYIDNTSKELSIIHNKYGYKFYDYSFIPTSIDSDFIDGFHGDSGIYEFIINQISSQGDSKMESELLEDRKINC